jgi:O-6-methylguanine DNA methyltransferase
VQLFEQKIKTPLGEMLAMASDDGICLFDFPYRKMMPQIRQRVLAVFEQEPLHQSHPLIEKLATQLEAYFNGSLREFDVPLQLIGSDFQVQVWKALQTIPFGKTRSYKQQAVFLGNEKAIRAVAKANGENCLAILIPCHRVIGEDGSLVGYAGGLRNKEWLLRHEQKWTGAHLQQQLFL